MCGWKSGRCFKVIIHVKDVGKKRLGGWVDLLHLVLHLDGLDGELLPWPGHPQHPGHPLQEDHSDLKWTRMKYCRRDTDLTQSGMFL